MIFFYLGHLNKVRNYQHALVWLNHFYSVMKRWNSTLTSQRQQLRIGHGVRSIRHKHRSYASACLNISRNFAHKNFCITIFGLHLYLIRLRRCRRNKLMLLSVSHLELGNLKNNSAYYFEVLSKIPCFQHIPIISSSVITAQRVILAENFLKAVEGKKTWNFSIILYFSVAIWVRNLKTCRRVLQYRLQNGPSDFLYLS